MKILRQNINIIPWKHSLFTSAMNIVILREPLQYIYNNNMLGLQAVQVGQGDITIEKSGHGHQ